jgi:uncharacterized protein
MSMVVRFLTAFAVLVFAASAQAGTIDCGRPASRVETAICGDPELKAREIAIDQLFGAELRDDPAPRIRVLSKRRVKDMEACDIDRACIAHYQKIAAGRFADSDRPRIELPPFRDKHDPFLLYFDEYAKMRITIVRRVGMDTKNAVITAKHTNREVCQDTWLTVSSRCIEEEHLRPLLRLTANCPAGTFATLYGDDRKFIGGVAEDRAGYGIVDVATGDNIKVTDPDAYARDLAQFRALCPSRF